MTYNRIKMTVTILIVLLLGTAAFAQHGSTTGTLLLQGIVPGILEISVEAEPAASALDLTITETGLKVATVIERSNKRSGYTVSLESANTVAAGNGELFLKGSDPDNEDVIVYEIAIDGNPVDLSSGSSVISDVNGRTSRQGTSRDVVIAYDGLAVFPYEDSYSDTLTFTITAK